MTDKNSPERKVECSLKKQYWISCIHFSTKISYRNNNTR